MTLPVAGNEVKELKYVVDLQAVGAMKQLGAGLRILGINKSNVETVDFGAGAAQRDGSLSASRMRRLAVNLSFLCLEMHILYMDIPEHNVLC